MNSVSVRLFFAAGHRILGLTGPGEKCRNPHGHTFHLLATWDQQPGWPPAVEFGQAKAALRDFIKQCYDHGFFVDKADQAMRDFLEREGCRHTVTNGPPTTERLTELLARDIRRLVPNAALRRLVLEEGPENSATYECL